MDARQHAMTRHLPNIVSALRLLAAPLAAWLILEKHDTASLLVFILAGSSDAVDGYIARRWGVTSTVGAWLDPVADKLLMLFCLTALYMVEAASAWLIFLVVARDVTIAAGWLLIRWLHLPVRTEPLLIGKVSTMVQVLYILAMLLLLAFDLDMPRLAGTFAWICGLVTAVSAAGYAGMFLRGVVSPGPAA
jgi:cardiolipin synthase